MNEFMRDPATWTTEQWLAVCILGFILLAILVLVHRLLTILNFSRKSTYRPNFRRLRRFPRTHSSHEPTGSDEEDKDAQH